MKNKYRLRQSMAIRQLQGGMLALAAALLFAVPVASNAQEISTAVRGTVSAPDGSPAAGQSVTVTDTRTGSRRQTTTSASGSFQIRGLPVGGPYEIRVESTQYQGALVTDVFTNLSAPANFNIILAPSGDMEEIIITARMVQTVDLAIGPGTSFGIEEIEAMPSIARQIRDVIRTDPRVDRKSTRLNSSH